MNKKHAFFTTRIEPDILDLMRTVSQARGETKASLVRRAILKELAQLKYLDPERRKALGLSGQEVC